MYFDSKVFFIFKVNLSVTGAKTLANLTKEKLLR